MVKREALCPTTFDNVQAFKLGDDSYRSDARGDAVGRNRRNVLGHGGALVCIPRLASWLGYHNEIGLGEKFVVRWHINIARARRWQRRDKNCYEKCERLHRLTRTSSTTAGGSELC